MAAADLAYSCAHLTANGRVDRPRCTSRSVRSPGILDGATTALAVAGLAEEDAAA